MITKSVSIKDAGGKSGGRVSKAVELIAGELLHGLEFVTEEGVIHPDPAAAVSSGRSTLTSYGWRGLDPTPKIYHVGTVCNCV
jgi:hypothetical protein